MKISWQLTKLLQK